MAKLAHTPEVKREAVRHARQPGVSITRVAKDLGVHANTLRMWCKKFGEGTWNEKPGAELRTEQAKELERLRRENAELRMERDILKKAAAYFAKESK